MAVQGQPVPLSESQKFPKYENEYHIVKKDTTAQAGSLGLFAFGMTTFLASIADAGAYHENSTILAQALVFGGIGQFVAGVMEWYKGHEFTATAFCSFGSFWVSFVLINGVSVLGWGTAPSSDSLSCFLLIWTIFDLLMFICTIKKSICDILIFGLLLIHLLLGTIGHWAESEKTIKAAGYFGAIDALTAIYTAAAALINKSYKKVLLPTGEAGEHCGESLEEKTE